MFYGMPTPGNVRAEERFAASIFSVTRQLHYSKDETQLALDDPLGCRRRRQPRRAQLFTSRLRPAPAALLDSLGWEG
jgi:hypothetical protein